MGFLTFFSRSLIKDPTDRRALALRDEVVEMESTIRNDWSKRVSGDGTYSGYQTLRQFYKGRQWSFKKDGGGTMRTYNYCFTIVENMTAFLTNEPPQMSSPPRKVDDAVERALAEGRTKILNEVHEDNGLPLVFQRAARTGSINGDAFIFGSIPYFTTEVTYGEDGKVNGSTRKFAGVKYWNVEKPETVRPIWRDDNYNEMSGFVMHYRLSVAVAKKLFAEEIADGKFMITPDIDYEKISLEPEPSDVPMTTIKEYWDDQEYLLMFNKDNKIVEYVNHKWGFLPLHFVPNIHIPGEPKGTSDLENELDAQQEYNERNSDLADIIKEIARPTYWGKNLDNPTEIRTGQTVMYSFGDDAELNAMPRSGQTMAMEQYINDRKNDIIGLSGMNQVLYPGSQVLQATGRALSVVMQGVNNKISLRKDWWVQAFKGLNKSILYHIQENVPNAKLVIQDYFKTDVFISSVLLRNVSDEINKFQAKLQSLTTTQHNVGVPNPSEEQKLMKEELQDPILATEIAKQPGLLHQILAERVAQMNGATGGAVTGMGMGGVNGAPPGIASESDNAPGENPAAAGGVAPKMSPQGAINAMASRSGAATKVVSKK